MCCAGGQTAQVSDGPRVGGPVHGHAGRAVHGGARDVRHRAVCALSGTQFWTLAACPMSLL